MHFPCRPSTAVTLDRENIPRHATPPHATPHARHPPSDPPTRSHHMLATEKPRRLHTWSADCLLSTLRSPLYSFSTNDVAGLSEPHAGDGQVSCFFPLPATRDAAETLVMPAPVNRHVYPQGSMQPVAAVHCRGIHSRQKKVRRRAKPQSGTSSVAGCGSHQCVVPGGGWRIRKGHVVARK